MPFASMDRARWLTNSIASSLRSSRSRGTKSAAEQDPLKYFKILLKSPPACSTNGAFWGEQPPFMPFGCGGRYFFVPVCLMVCCRRLLFDLLERGRAHSYPV